MEWLTDPQAWVALEGYIYFAMAFSVGVEMLNMRTRKTAAPGFEQAESG